MALPDCTEEELQALYEWVDSVPLSRPKKSIARDFADGVLMAELVHHYFPRLVELHNYSPAHNSMQKTYNWGTLNQKVFKRMGFALAKEQYEAVANAEVGAVERVLKLVRTKMARFQEQGGRVSHCRQGSQGAGSQPGSPIRAARQLSADVPAAVAAALNDTIAALRIAAPPAAPGATATAAAASKLLQSGALGHPPSAAFPTLDHALAANLASKEQQLQELEETNEILETKISKLEQLVRLKDAKIQALLARLQQAEGAAA